MDIVYLLVYSRIRFTDKKFKFTFSKPSLGYCAWLAGFWEGEGSLRRGSCLALTIAQKEKHVLQEVARMTDGKIYFQAASNSHRVYWYGERAFAALRIIAPHVRSDYRKRQIAIHCPEVVKFLVKKEKIIIAKERLLVYLPEPMSAIVQIPRTVREYLAAIGRKGGKLGGRARTEAKTDAARKNGAKGGRPRKQSNGKRKAAK